MKTNSTISLGIFFDGTGNNGINATSPNKPSKHNGSYHSNPTNIYKLFGLFEGDEKIYVEGIGTIAGAEDSLYAMATCKNPVGYVGYSFDNKLAKALDFIRDQTNDKQAAYELYVYGFSRGATLARNFCQKLHESPQGSIGSIRIKFLGIFDTVESTPFHNYDVSISPAVENVLHFCAINECRYYFPLTAIFEGSAAMENINYTKGNLNWKEIYVPGAHADVGGGYLPARECVYVSENYIRKQGAIDYVENVRHIQKDLHGQEIWDDILEDFQLDVGKVFTQAYVDRDFVYNDLPKVYGKLMLLETNKHQSVFCTDFDQDNFDIDPKEHPFLISFEKQLVIYLNQMELQAYPVYNYKELVGYTHISANFGLHTPKLTELKAHDVQAQLVNNYLNTPAAVFAADLDNDVPILQSPLNLLSEGSNTSYLYGSNIPNNSDWKRSVIRSNQ